MRGRGGTSNGAVFSLLRADIVVLLIVNVVLSVQYFQFLIQAGWFCVKWGMFARVGQF